MFMPFGKHVGCDIADIPDGYLRWLHNRELWGPLRVAVDAEYLKRFAAPPPDNDSPPLQDDVRAMAAEMVRAGWRALAEKHHPDKGGETYEMQLVNLARDFLRRSLQ